MEMGGGGFGAFMPQQSFHMRYSGRQRQFRRFYSAYPIAAYQQGNKMDANYGGKIFMPPSSLDEISQLEVVYPLLFKLQNDEEEDEQGKKPRTHCGVLEFTAEEGRVYLPQWMMETLRLAPGSAVEVINVALLHGSLVKIQPQSVDFLDISDHRAVLENALRRFSALTVGDIITIEYNNREYRIAVRETQPSPSAINIVETDLSVDFEPPVGYVEPTAQSSRASITSSAGLGSRPASSIAKDIHKQEESIKSEAANLRFQAFRGVGARLSSGTERNADSNKPTSLRSYASSVTPDIDNSQAAAGNGDLDEETPVPLDLPIGTLFFGYRLVPPAGSQPDDQQTNQSDEPKFQGQGRALRQRRKR
ncbi:ubiquitin fusion degradation protein [Coemansia brasiliensis]|uniref:Ubiquitin fusion degradation protein n=1 Tax=Coemansia brasiliensis TaxID=2650707 RepID=A0A9W8I6Q0_9FUNG|nr:ubiquitin fusion degradation protein [Coemansia brasiliensis]